MDAKKANTPTVAVVETFNVTTRELQNGAHVCDLWFELLLADGSRQETPLIRFIALEPVETFIGNLRMAADVMSGRAPPMTKLPGH